jgi:8-oxo-dGTP diphosphatase
MTAGGDAPGALTGSPGPSRSRGQGDPASDPPVPVVAAVIRRGEAVLLGLRPPEKRHGGLWEFPGGKVAPGESEAEALARELLEELGVKVEQVGELLAAFRDPGSPFEIRFRSVRIHGRPEALEHTELRWVTRTEARGLPLAPTDRRFTEEML